MTPDPEPTLEDALDGLLAATYYARAAGLDDLCDRSAALYQDLGANAADEDWDGADEEPVRWDEPIAAADDLYDRARSQWGDDAQLAKLAEESAELAAVTSRALNGQADPDAFLEELVDARIMIEQFAHCYTPDRLEPFVAKGVDDLDRRLEDDPEIATDGGTDVDSTCRDGSRLEIDDPEHCKQCGAELPDVDETDAQGRPMMWTKGQWESLEICPDCWTEKQIEKLRRQCMDRYDGECPEVLWDV